MAKIHMTLQGKGGVGKSFIASVLAQYLIGKGESPSCIDTDPINMTFHGYKALNVHHLKIMDDDEINSRNFDMLVELLAKSTETVIIDNGASSFVPLTHYIISNHVPSLITELGHELVIHTVITGGQAMLDTINGFIHIAGQLPEGTAFVVWLNPYWGPIEQEGKAFEETRAYLMNKHRISAIAQIPPLKEETYGRDLGEMLQARLTFEEAIAMSSLTIMSRQRLKLIQRKLFEQLEKAVVM